MAGRPVGSKNTTRRILPKSLSDSAMVQLTRLVDNGDWDAVKFTLERVYPGLKAITPANSIDAEVLRARIHEAVEFDRRLAALESRNDK
ncbi:TPA: hypothetical protein N2N50_000650 [Kluyvera ascorbata]|nr:hypothetical protein STW0522KLE44_19870 [Klebsiella sp. STW0522-44]HAT7515194.1 hypothetical protein [Kluyvera ascorbata]HCL5619691.1 hypothetical protein [Kluyvera ascorbata]HED3204136.1 hypothetical protein [Kluyvera ascorbata]HED4089073.1 hypothetical protein [Kluyvera ascorbata]